MDENNIHSRREQIVRFVEDSMDAISLQKDGAQRLKEFHAELKKIGERFSITNQYADEEVKSSYGYMSGYKDNRNKKIELIIDDFEAQIKVLDRHFNCGKRFNPDWIIRAHRNLPDWVEKFFAQFPWKHIAPTYGEAVQKVLYTIKYNRNGTFYNYREHELGSDQFRQSEKTRSMFQMLGDEQKCHDILAVPAQFGIRHRGRSVRRARAVMNAKEAGLSTFSIGNMLLTHPERLMHSNDLWVDCAGDEFSERAHGDFSKYPYLKLRSISIRFNTGDVSRVRDLYGSASMFLP